MKQETDLQPILDVQISQLESTLQLGSAIDAKALAVIATDVALLIFMAQGRLYFQEWWQTATLYAPFFISLVFAALSLRPELYVGAGLTPKQVPAYVQMPAVDRMLQLISTATYGIETNTALNRKRWRLCLLSIVFTAVGSGAILLYYV